MGVGAVWRAVCPPRSVRRDAVWAVHMVSAAILLLPWGIWLMLPLDTFGTGLAYRTMGALAPEAVWGVIFASVGVLLYVGTVLGHARVQAVAAGLAALAFALIASTLLFGNPAGAGWLTFSIPAVANFWAFKKLFRPRRA